MPAQHPRTPRDLADLPYAHRLEPFEGELEREGDYEAVHFDGCDFEELDGGSAAFAESAFSSVAFNGGRYRRARFDDVWTHQVRWVGADLAESRWTDCESGAGLLAGVELFSAQLRRVTFHHCKFDSVNLRVAALRDVAFVDCLLRDVDFGGAALTQVSFPGSTLDRVRFDDVKADRADLSEAAALGIASGLEAMRGVTISPLQLLELAPALAGVVGLKVREG
ncbi:pentapeptide repeat-containing protein [Streptomyces aureoverticillatus]|uniref:pentapeptide repeat-containing protein n=1 Tax=Streptomyces aureoverticillatus TaxID=66871 RepID=UPI0019545D35|nr:pentapeptide repeat-containing protein [Streptomyces aureoverticillatus]